MTRPVHDASLEALADRVEVLAGDKGGRVILGIAGAPGAGKTTLALLLLDQLRARHGEQAAAHLPMDGFHLADAQLDRLGLRSRKGAPETFDADGYAACLRRVAASGRDVYVPGFERDLEQPIAAALVVPAAARFVISEGNYVLLPGWEETRSACTAVWFVVGDEDVRRSRLVTRHVQFGKVPEAAAAWVDDVDGANATLVATGAERADLIVCNSAQGWMVESR